MNETAQRILETAARLFIERGYELVGINEIIAKSDVAKATFYTHFKSKEKLCVAWLHAMRDDAAVSLEKLLAQPLPASELVTLRFDMVAARQVATAYRGCPFSNTAAMVPEDNEVRAAVLAYKSASRDGWHAIAARFGRGPEATAALGDDLFLLYSGAITEAQNFRDLWPVQAARSAALRLCETP